MDPSEGPKPSLLPAVHSESLGRCSICFRHTNDSATMQALLRNVLPFRLQRIGLLLTALSLGSGLEIALGYQKPPILEETIPESLRGDPKIEGLVSQLTLARRSLAGIGTAHPSYAKTKKLIEQLETSLAGEINSLMSGSQADAAVSMPVPVQPAPIDEAPSNASASVQSSSRRPPKEAISAKGGDGAEINMPLQSDLPEVTTVFERLPVRRFVRLGAFPDTRILWGLEEGGDADPSRLWKWGDFERAAAQKVLFESEEKILDIQFPDDFLKSGVCYLLTLGKGATAGNVRLLRWEILDAGDPSPSGRQEVVLGTFRTDHRTDGRFASGPAEPLVVLWDHATEFVPADRREILEAPDRRSFLIESQSGMTSQEAFRSVAETSRKAWATWGAFGPVAVTKEGLLFVSGKGESTGGSILDLSLPAFLKPSTGEKSSGPFFVYRGKSMPWLAGDVLFAGDDRLTIYRLQLSREGTLEALPVARSPQAIVALGESSEKAILVSSEEGIAAIELKATRPKSASVDRQGLINPDKNGTSSDRIEWSSLDAMARLQLEAFEKGSAPWGYWGLKPDRFVTWSDHSNRLIPAYCFGGSFSDYLGENSVYRSEEKLAQLYGQVPEDTVNPEADYMDQTNLYDLQRRALERGKKYLFLVVFDGMDWQTTLAASVYFCKGVRYLEGRGSGLSFQDYRGAETDFGLVVASPFSDECQLDPDAQKLTQWGTKLGGYSSRLGGSTPWSPQVDINYLLGRSRLLAHPYPDSSSAATSMTTGVKTYNGSVGIGPNFELLTTIAHRAQSQYHMSVGAVTNVPICDATIGASYAHNVDRNDFQDISRDLLGLPSIAHRNKALPGMDLLIGAGFGVSSDQDPAQGVNYQPGNRYLADADMEKVSVEAGGKYRVAKRTKGIPGHRVLEDALVSSIDEGSRFLGFFGTQYGHLPYQTANGDYLPVGNGKQEPERYSEEDIVENPTLAQMTNAAMRHLGRNPNGFWLMVEPGDIDRANHANNIDNSIGAVLSGVEAFDEITRWIEERDAWSESLVIVTTDHGHAFHLTQPETIVTAANADFEVGKKGPAGR
jgi:alkaline phosphatase